MRIELTVTHREAYRAGAAALLIALATIVAALGFQFIGGFEPCHLCLLERYAYYAGVPLLFLSLVGVSGDHARLAAAGFALVALAFLANAGLGTYHSGAEYGFWPGPTTCSGPLTPLNSPADLLKGLKTAHVARCDQAPWWFMGLSMAGWNVVASLIVGGLSAIAALTAIRAGRQQYPTLFR